ncbi:type VII secretion target [Nocardia sp. NPDC051832]|uniref:type VII secretion target n=1 Tax=Nocardia sp. NPDC051832 TaxID=3155673 RepID=UPI00343A1739
MADLLQVEIAVLSKSVQALRTSEQLLTDAMKAMSQDSRGEIGTTELDDAADDFQKKWKFGIERIGESAKDLADRLDTAVKTYEDADKTFAKALDEAKNLLGEVKA